MLASQCYQGHAQTEKCCIVFKALSVHIVFFFFIAVSVSATCSLYVGLSPNIEQHTPCILAKTDKGNHCSREALVNTSSPCTDETNVHRQALDFDIINMQVRQARTPCTLGQSVLETHTWMHTPTPTHTHNTLINRLKHDLSFVMYTRKHKASWLNVSLKVLCSSGLNIQSKVHSSLS